MPYLVGQLLEGKAVPITIPPEETVSHAISLMIQYDYSQLPVVEEIGYAIGMITYESILRGIRHFKTSAESLHVRDVMISAPSTTTEANLFDMLNMFEKANAVLIEDTQGLLTGIVTSYDATHYFRSRAEDMMRVENIETMVKEFILLPFTDQDGEVDEAAVQSLVETVNHDEKKKDIKFTDLSLAQYNSILIQKSRWDFFAPIFQISREAVFELLDNVRKTRNDLAHFRNEISDDQSDQLRFADVWLSARWEEFDQKREAEFRKRLFAKIMNQGEEVYPTDWEEIPVSSPEIIGSPVEFNSSEVVPIFAEEASRRESRYAPLIDYLQSQPGRIDTIQLTFEEIEEIVEGGLPASARDHRAWWANDSVGHNHSQLWLEAGWRRTWLNMTEETVTFARIKEREHAYIDFFSKLLIQLQKETSYDVRDVSPDGTNWVVIEHLRASFGKVGEMNFAFTHGAQFRVEMYLDTGHYQRNKYIFDLIRALKPTLEAKLGTLSWERIDDKRACRIASYHDGSILESEDTLSDLRNWAVPMMLHFLEGLKPLLIETAEESLEITDIEQE